MALTHITPVLPIRLSQPFDDANWIFEPKHDGYRGMLYIDGNDSYFRSKKDKPLDAFADLAGKVRKELRARSAILDGEIAVVDPETGYSDFEALQKRQGIVMYMAFDLLWLNGKDLTDIALHERKQRLLALIHDKGWVQNVDCVAAQGIRFMHQIVAAGLEGMIAKEKNEKYGRRTRWFKILNPDLVIERRVRARMFAGFRSKQKA